MAADPHVPAGDDFPHAPWALVGESMVAVVRARGRASGGLRRAGVPRGVRALPGPSFVFAVRYTESPIGPFLELAVAQPATIGLRIGLCFTTSVVSSSPARVGGRLGWGIPRQLGALTWTNDGNVSRLRWEERGIEVAGRADGLKLPFLVPVRSLQRRADGPVVVPGRLRGRAHLGRIDVTTPDDDALAWLQGRHRGLAVRGLHLVLKPARHPLGLMSSLGAPLRAADPALGGFPVPEPFVPGSTSASRYSARSARALSSVG